jgi:hypothetical protein
MFTKGGPPPSERSGFKEIPDARIPDFEPPGAFRRIWVRPLQTAPVSKIPVEYERKCCYIFRGVCPGFRYSDATALVPADDASWETTSD